MEIHTRLTSGEAYLGAISSPLQVSDKPGMNHSYVGTILTNWTWPA